MNRRQATGARAGRARRPAPGPDRRQPPPEPAARVQRLRRKSPVAARKPRVPAGASAWSCSWPFGGAGWFGYRMADGRPLHGLDRRRLCAGLQHDACGEGAGLSRNVASPTMPASMPATSSPPSTTATTGSRPTRRATRSRPRRRPSPHRPSDRRPEGRSRTGEGAAGFRQAAATRTELELERQNTLAVQDSPAASR